MNWWLYFSPFYLSVCSINQLKITFKSGNSHTLLVEIQISYTLMKGNLAIFIKITNAYICFVVV